MHQTLGLGKGTSGLSENFKFLTNNVVTCIEQHNLQHMALKIQRQPRLNNSYLFCSALAGLCLVIIFSTAYFIEKASKT